MSGPKPTLTMDNHSDVVNRDTNNDVVPTHIYSYDPAYEWPGECSTSCSTSDEISVPTTPAYIHDRAYEWPGDGDTYDPPDPIFDSQPQEHAPDTYEHLDSYHGRSRGSSPGATYGAPGKAPDPRGGFPLLRLLVHSTAIFPKKQRLVLIPSPTCSPTSFVEDPVQVQFGRDLPPPGSPIPRVRLKEMAVSKVHASIFWHAARGRKSEWSVVDLGSKYGTFLRRRRDPIEEGDGGGIWDEQRLSKEREASLPHTLRHLDLLSMGNTTFQVHIHGVESGSLPCAECSPSRAEEEIPLFATNRRKKIETPPPKVPVAGQDAKKALGSLKQKLLTRHVGASGRSSPSVKAAGGNYIDRSARRRSLHPASHPDAPGVSVPLSRSDSAPPSVVSMGPPPQLEPVVSAPPTPLPSSNVGHRLLVKQGWAPGTALGLDLASNGAALVEPLEVSSTTNRAGLGMPAPLSTSPLRRWRER